jgi:hypothetical protein
VDPTANPQTPGTLIESAYEFPMVDKHNNKVAMMRFINFPSNKFFIACRRTLLTVGVLLYYNSKDITMSSVFDNPTSEEPGVAKIFSTKRKQQLKSCCFDC